MIKSLGFVVAILVLALAIDHACAHPRRGDRDRSGGRLQGGRRGGHRGRFPPQICLLVNTTGTSDDPLCSSPCPVVKPCQLDERFGFFGLFLTGINVSVCEYQSCPAGVSSGCPPNTTCVTEGDRSLCLPDVTDSEERPGRRGTRRGPRHHDSSSFEDDEDEEDFDLEEQEEDSPVNRFQCLVEMSEIVRQRIFGRRPSTGGQGQRPNGPTFFGGNPFNGGPSGGRRGQEGDRTGDIGFRGIERFGEDVGVRHHIHHHHHGHHGPRVCSIFNMTSNELLCNNTCPQFQMCVNESDPEFKEGRPELENLNFAICRFKACAEPLDCEANTTCVMNDDDEFECRPNCNGRRGRRHGNRHHSSSEESGEGQSCRRVLHEIHENAEHEDEDETQDEGQNGPQGNGQDRRNPERRPERRIPFNGGEGRRNGENANGNGDRRRGQQDP